VVSAASIPERAAPSPALPPRERFLNRELSWLAFDRRVLALAADPSLPLLERVNFLAIFASNLDEFFQLRVAGLKEQRAAGIGATSADGRTPEEQLAGIRVEVPPLVRLACELFHQELRPALAGQGIHVCDWSALPEGARAHLGRVFEREIFPVLTPLAVDPAHPFPHISNLSLNLAVLVQDPATRAERFARVKVPPLFPRFLPLPDGAHFVPIEQVIASRLDALFPGMRILSQHAFRVTRDADIPLEESEAEDLLEALEVGLRWRQHASGAVRLEISADASHYVTSILAEELELGPDDVYATPGLLDLRALAQFHALPRPELKDAPCVPQTQRALGPRGEEPADLFALLRDRDVLVHHPYDSFATSVQAFLERAAADPNVLAIKHTLYRTSGPENPIVHTLIRAAEAGKQVVTLVEVKARFDERANIEWARMLERAGVHVVYGLVGLKTHAKAALVIRREADGIRRYCHVGTGNYNPTTAKLYEDLGILSASPELCADLAELFNHLTGCSRQRHYRKILVAPESLRAALLDWIRAEAAQPDGRIVLKLNHLEDPELIDALYAASQAGAEIDLVVRGICGLRPGVAGLSERIRVRSILGRFLEHSRIFRFGSDARGPRYFVGSADLVRRKLEGRVELVVPVEAPALRARLEEVLRLCLSDGAAWTLDANGRWTRGRAPGPHLQERLQELARERASAREEPAEARRGSGVAAPRAAAERSGR
jgi:polyphosphate kinase